MIVEAMASATHPKLPFGESSEPTGDDQRLLSVEELADYFEVPVKTIYTWRHRNSGPKGFRVGKHLRFRWHDVQAWVAQRLADEN
ncbi:MAG TPA: helix-turn-helix domain-containing protein [Acidimicrobiia bacterium]|jgi:excisionase family DNA binding protein|nr:helix-turn-helix domain-containing protein [Acidimicrobiia bacterium]